MSQALKITAKATDLFFDREKMKKIADKSKKDAIVKQLAFIRQTARRTVLRRRKKPSAPGKAPSIHKKGQGGLKAIWFIAQNNYSSGIVGPVLDRSYDDPAIDQHSPVPQVLEFGGSYTVEEYRFDARVAQGYKGWRKTPKGYKRARGEQVRKRKVTIRPRPFMSTALDIEVESGHIMNPWVGVFTE